MENENSGTPVVENNETQSSDKNTQQEQKKLSYEEMEAELKRVRNEAASRRIELKDLKSKADEWDKYQESQKTELEKLQEALAAKEKALADYEFDKTKRSVLKEYELDEDDLDLLTGADEQAIRKQAEKLKAKNEKLRANSNSSRPADLLAGNRGKPVGSTENTKTFDDVIRGMVNGRR